MGHNGNLKDEIKTVHVFLQTVKETKKTALHNGEKALVFGQQNHQNQFDAKQNFNDEMQYSSFLFFFFPVAWR